MPEVRHGSHGAGLGLVPTRPARGETARRALERGGEGAEERGQGLGQGNEEGRQADLEEEVLTSLPWLALLQRGCSFAGLAGDSERVYCIGTELATY